MAATPRITRVFGAINIGSVRISAMIAGLSETGEMIVLGSGHRASQGIKRGYVTDMTAATYVRDWAQPQFYFHLVAAYAVMRHLGVPLGKPDYVSYMMQYLRPGTAPTA